MAEVEALENWKSQKENGLAEKDPEKARYELGKIHGHIKLTFHICS